MKGKVAHKIPLSRQALDILKGLPPRFLGKFVFSHPSGRNPISDYHLMKKALDELSGVTGWTLHDVRRTVASGLGSLEISPEIIERVLAHTQPKLHATYNRFDCEAEKGAALQKWADHVSEIIV